MMDEDRRKAYDQECQNMRYQDGLRWSRFQTVTVIEGAYLAVIYTTNFGSQHSRSLALALFASLVIFFICLLAIKDGNDAEMHLDRVRKLEKDMEVPAVTSRYVLGMRGKTMMVVVIVLLNIFNIVVAIDQIVSLCKSV